MIFQTANAIDKILRREKTQTRRIVKGHAPQYIEGAIQAVYLSQGCPPVYEVGRTYAVQPGRGKRSVWYCALNTTEGVDYHILTDGDDAPLYEAGAKQLRIRILTIRRQDVREISEADARAEGYEYRSAFLRAWCQMHCKKALTTEGTLQSRPAKFFQAWALTFEVAQ